MLLKTRYGLEFSNPSESEIETALGSLSQGDQLVLVDQDLNEIRVFGPLDGTYHIFCSLTREGRPFRAEKALSWRDTLATLVGFTAHDLDWAAHFTEVPPPDPRSQWPTVVASVALFIIVLTFIWLGFRSS